MEAKSKQSGKKLIRRLYWSFILLLLFLLVCNLHVYLLSRHLQYKSVLEVPAHKAGLVLGTSKYLRNGGSNQYFLNRIMAAVVLYRAGKVEYLILSGDNRHSSYNEPLMMKKELMRLGVPEEVIYLDFAGFRTLDSVVRCKEIFGQQEIIIISQSFHNRRALFIAKMNGIEAIGFNAPDILSFTAFRTKFREIFARVKMLLDVYIFKTKPHFLGDKIRLGDTQEF
ncbi:vancomycin high temperature exclusion protein [Bacteroidota bacterium]